MGEPSDWFQPSRDLRIPFTFVPHGSPDPVEWKAAHPGWVKFPATFVPRQRPGESSQSEPAVAEQTPQPVPQPGMMAAFSRRPEPPPLHALDPFDPMSPGFDAVATLRRVGYLTRPSADAAPIHPPSEISDKSRRDDPGATGDSSNVDATPVPLLDDTGKPVLGASGQPVIRPAGLDPHFFIRLGQVLLASRSETDDNATSGLPDGSLETYLNLLHFWQGAAWDAQRIGNKKHPEFREVSTIYIGLYGAAAGMDIDVIRSLQNWFAAHYSSFRDHPQMSSEYSSLPELNVDNTRIGYELYNTGRIGPLPD